MSKGFYMTTTILLALTTVIGFTSTCMLSSRMSDTENNFKGMLELEQNTKTFIVSECSLVSEDSRDELKTIETLVTDEVYQGVFINGNRLMGLPYKGDIPKVNIKNLVVCPKSYGEVGYDGLALVEEVFPQRSYMSNYVFEYNEEYLISSFYKIPHSK